MSDALFPTLPGLAWNVKKTPTFSTIVQRSASGREVRAALMDSATYEWELSYDILRADTVNAELQTLLGFYLARRGSFDSFLYHDSTDDTATNQTIAVGDGITRNFQLARALGGASGNLIEPVYGGIFGTPSVTVGGAMPTFGADYTVTDTSLLVFNAPPTAGATIVASFNFFHRVRFKDDTADFNNFSYQLWEMRQINFVSAKP